MRQKRSSRLMARQIEQNYDFPPRMADLPLARAKVQFVTPLRV